MKNSQTYVQKTHSSNETKQVALLLASHVQAGDVIVLTGDLGAGKTQFVQGVAKGLGIKAAVTSPTFNILLTYSEGRLPLYHFDLYRLEYDEELEDIGFFETIEGDGISLIEWGEKFPNSLPSDYLEIAILRCEDNSFNSDENEHKKAACNSSEPFMFSHDNNENGFEEAVCNSDISCSVEAARCIEVRAQGRRAEELLDAWILDLHASM